MESKDRETATEEQVEIVLKDIDNSIEIASREIDEAVESLRLFWLKSLEDKVKRESELHSSIDRYFDTEFAKLFKNIKYRPGTNRQKIKNFLTRP